jgi:eukaryotic-like serine/threonine-protein kinase
MNCNRLPSLSLALDVVSWQRSGSRRDALGLGLVRRPWTGGPAARGAAPTVSRGGTSPHDGTRYVAGTDKNDFTPQARTPACSSGEIAVLARQWEDEAAVSSEAWVGAAVAAPGAWSADPLSALFGAATLIPPQPVDSLDLRADVHVFPHTRPPTTGRRASGMIGRYRLIERIGRGRQADVWRAVGENDATRVVALKVLPAAEVHRDPRRRAQLRREAERGVRLTGPSLLPILEYGEDAGTSFMAMPLVLGCTLADVISQRLDFGDGQHIGAGHRLAFVPDAKYSREVAVVMTRVAHAAHEAHRGLVVHRDIKPGNVLLRHDHASGVYLCDFGLARDLDVATPGQLRDGAGSPLYMAPERLLKRPADEVRCDVFALGVTLCEALTLRPPLEVPAGLPREHWAEYLATTVPHAPSKLRPTIPPALEDIVLRATARDPARRYPTAAEFAHDLFKFLGETPAPRTDWDW